VAKIIGLVNRSERTIQRNMKEFGVGTYMVAQKNSLFKHSVRKLINETVQGGPYRWLCCSDGTVRYGCMVPYKLMENGSNCLFRLQDRHT
jgi:hypothetical protein